MDNLVFIQIDNEAEIRDETNEFSFVLKPSPLGGIGVFCTHGIKKGTRLHLFPRGSRLITHKEIKLKTEVFGNNKLINFCNFYGVEDKEGFWVPKSFNCIDVGWYLNHSDNFNSIHDEKYRYFNDKDLQGGEEITINYNHL